MFIPDICRLNVFAHQNKEKRSEKKLNSLRIQLRIAADFISGLYVLLIHGKLPMESLYSIKDFNSSSSRFHFLLTFYYEFVKVKFRLLCCYIRVEFYKVLNVTNVVVMIFC